MTHTFNQQPEDPVGSWAFNVGYAPGDYVSPDGQRIYIFQGWRGHLLVCSDLSGDTYTTLEDRPDVFRSLPPHRTRLLGLRRKETA